MSEFTSNVIIHLRKHCLGILLKVDILTWSDKVDFSHVPKLKVNQFLVKNKWKWSLSVFAMQLEWYFIVCSSFRF